MVGKDLIMSKIFTVTTNEEPVELIEKIRRRFSNDSNISFNGNEDNGAFSGRGIFGKYHIKDDLITITIEKKPFYIPWIIIEEEIKKFFS
jgi:hypothetical protein